LFGVREGRKAGHQMSPLRHFRGLDSSGARRPTVGYRDPEGHLQQSVEALRRTPLVYRRRREVTGSREARSPAPLTCSEPEVAPRCKSQPVSSAKVTFRKVVVIVFYSFPVQDIP
jgi:hypothetical protein